MIDSIAKCEEQSYECKVLNVTEKELWFPCSPTQKEVERSVMTSPFLEFDVVLCCPKLKTLGAKAGNMI